MSEWQVFQWGDGSQDGQDKWNIGIAGWETSIAFDLPKEVAQEIVDAHNLGAAENKRLKAAIWGHKTVMEYPTSPEVKAKADMELWAALEGGDE